MPDGQARPIELTVNDARHTVEVDPDTPLLYVLRDDLGLKGTRFGCGTGFCGACMVIIDGRPITSCDLPVEAAARRSVTTIEGLATAHGLDPVQQAVIDGAAGQCGYCLSGIVMSAAALLEREPDPTDEQIGEALEHNICRCGAHPRIIGAVRSAAASMRR